MSERTPPLAAETEAIRKAYAALNRNDIAGFVQVFDPQIERIERIETADFPQGRTYHGLAAVTAHVAEGRGTWAEGGCEPQRFIVAPPDAPPGAPPGAADRLIVFVHVRVRLKHETQWREGRTVDVFTFRNGKAIQFHTFADEREALEWAGVKARNEG